MPFVMVILCFFLDLALSEYRLTWSDYQKINYLKHATKTENEYRRKIYMENVAKIEKHNDKFKKGLVSYSLAINQFTHLTDEEFDEIYSGSDPEDSLKLAKQYGYYRPPKNATIPDAVNWNTRGAVSPVKSQGKCGSCYAFSVVGTLESHYFIKYKKMTIFSEQQILDCGKSHQLNGCKGGTITKTLNYVRAIGLTKQAIYPYEGVVGPCRADNHPMILKVLSFQFIKKYEIRNMEAAIAFTGPVPVTIPGAPLKGLSGKEIFTGDTCNSTQKRSHTVIVVGYNTSANGQKYWIIKNSWGMNWGDQGYFYMDRKPEDPCGVTLGAHVTYIK